MEKLYFKAGEFAALCGVKKDTLFHYEKMGLLCPEKITANGYRWYSVKQLYTFDVIAALRRLNMPLADIRAYLEHRSPDTFLTLVEEKRKELAAERRRLAQMENLLAETVRGIRLAQEIQPGVIRLEDCSQEYYVAVPAPNFTVYEEKQYLLQVRPLLAWAREHGSRTLPPGDIVRKENMARGRFVEDAYYYKVEPGVTAQDLHVKPAGTYAVLYHQGSYETLETATRTLWDWILNQGYAPLGDLYEEDLLTVLTTEDTTAYRMRLSIQVDAGGQ